MDDENKASVNVQLKVEEAKAASEPSADNSTGQVKTEGSDNRKLDSEIRGLSIENTRSKEAECCHQLHEGIHFLSMWI